MPNYLKPHTAAWFDALEKQNPKLANQTREVISKAGNNEVCSICGDEPAKDYQLQSEQVTTEMVETLKLCDDCLEIRKSMTGGGFQPLTD